MNRSTHLSKSLSSRRNHLSSDGPVIGYSDPHRLLLGISRALLTNQPIERIIQMVLHALLESFHFDECVLVGAQALPTPLLILETLAGEGGFERFSFVKIEDVSLSLRQSIQAEKVCLLRPGKHHGDSPVSLKNLAQVVYPIHDGKGLFGAFVLTRTVRPFTAEEFDLAQLFFAQAAIAIEKILLADEAKTQTDIIQRLIPFTQVLNRPLKISEVAEAIGRGAMAVSGADRVAVFGQGSNQVSDEVWSQGISKTGIRQIDSRKDDCAPGSPVYMPDILQLETNPQWRSFSELEGVRAMALFPMVFEDQSLGKVDCFYDLPRDWSNTEKEALELFVRQAGVAVQNTRLYEELEKTYFQTVLTLARALNIRDAYTGDHSRRLAIWAERTARRMQCPNEEIKRIHWAALLHDIGKIGVPDAILHKAGPLTDDEWQVMKRHPELGASILAPVRYLNAITPIVRSHQERFDGTGYPDGLVGEQIPLAARIITVVDAFGAMTDDRVYRKAMTKNEALIELKRCAGKQFDEQVVKVFFDVIETKPEVFH